MDEDDGGFNIIQPSLIQQLKTILDQYPDDGQILKVRNIGGLKKALLSDYREVFLVYTSCVCYLQELGKSNKNNYSESWIGQGGIG